MRSSGTCDCPVRFRRDSLPPSGCALPRACLAESTMPALARTAFASLVLLATARAGDGVQYAFPGAVAPTPFDVGSVAALDVNGDGVLDLLAADFDVDPPQAS